MEPEPGDDYIRRIATHIRNNEQGLAAAGLNPRRRPKANANDSTSVFNPLGWFATDTNQSTPSVKPVVLSFDSHHLFYLLMRMEAIGIDVGSLDVKVENPSRPMNYVNVLQGLDKSDTLSLMSFATTFSAVSRLSLGSGCSFTKLPALSLHAPEPRLIAELANEAPNENAVPLDAFKNLQVLECVDIDPRTILGWDRLAESLKSLTIKRSGLEDVSDIFIGAVLDDQSRREGKTGSERLRRIPRAPPSRQNSFYSTRLPKSVPEDPEDILAEESLSTPSPEDTPKPPEFMQLPSLKWAFLRHLSLADNALTFIPSFPLPYLTSVTHLDISSNLLVSVPSGIYTMLGSILSLNLSRNRLENICGLERLLALQRVDLRNNLIDESAEIGRLATLPNISEIWVEGNPLCDIEEAYRIRCFDLFWKEGKSITLDGSPPGYYEKRYLSSPPPEQMTSSRPVSVALTPPAVPVGSPPPVANAATAGPSKSSTQQSSPTSSPPSHTASPQLAAVRGRRKKNKRIVDLDDVTPSLAAARTTSPIKAMAAESFPKLKPVAGPSSGAMTASASTMTPVPRPKPISRHSRHHTELTPPSPSVSKDAYDGFLPSASDDLHTLGHRRSATMSSKSGKRRSKISASVFEPASDLVSNGKDKEGKQFAEAEAFRARIEALRADMGDGWLKVFNQSHLGSPGVPSG
ncbi:unnamed protein product [Somion occarium]|uniref:Uncharacterized protein n=1 Tax=Somion occarium TaxID=3059160 RepID=A0ABP1DFF1_9APHY